MTTPDTETPTSSPADATTAAASTGEGQAEPQVSSPPNGETSPAPASSPAAPTAAPSPPAAQGATKEGASSDHLAEPSARAQEGEGKGEREGNKRRRTKKKHGTQETPDGEEAREARSKPDKSTHAPPRAAFRIGEEVFGRVKEVKSHALIIDIPGKGNAIFDTSEFGGEGTLPAVGDRFVAKVLGDGGRGGLVVLARKYFDDPTYEDKVKEEVEKAFQEKTVVLGLVTGVIKGGLEVYVKGLRAFAPASHVELRPGANLSGHIGQQYLFLVEQYAKKGRDIVLSRKAFLEEESKKQRDGSLSKLTVGAIVPGIVKSIVDFGIFVAIPEADNIEGLVHATEISHEPRVRIRDVVKIGEEIKVKVVKIDDKGKLWLSKKATEPDPWEQIRTKYAVGTRHKGKITRNKDFGSFVELEPGLEGLIHLTDLSLKRIESPSDVVKEGQEIDVVVASFDTTNRKIGLHPAPAGIEQEPRQKVAPHKTIKVAVAGHD
ncbi:MAG: S1 RNA-binding domain-containing protein, partial [Myxococcales bacterium]|nr:S1 RNA-binding domain-containing protein [Polyangiaceae bacterium]MDW8249595.1 S1 RNA-binding domain-containing protein [Myxococcales bacterium]